MWFAPNGIVSTIGGYRNSFLVPSHEPLAAGWAAVLAFFYLDLEHFVQVGVLSGDPFRSANGRTDSRFDTRSNPSFGRVKELALHDLKQFGNFTKTANLQASER
jgi:hypothetical protein